MNSKLIIILIVTGLWLFSCTSSNEKNIDNTKELAFKKFVSRQRLIDLPLHFDLAYISDSLTQPMIQDDLDSLFIPTDIASGRIWGIYKDTSSFYVFINLATAAVYIPEIKIFDKQGNIVQSEQLLVNGCGADCGYYCNAIANIYKEPGTSDIKFFARDSVYSYTCDSVGKETPGTLEHYTKSKLGSIDKAGHITVKMDSVNLLK